MTRAAAARARDEAWMQRCLELADEPPGRISPNPRVGCVVVDRRGRLLSEGAHRGPGTDHAEIDALRGLGRRARGATLYVNLEPCMHQGRTPPCAPALVEAGVGRVVIGAADPILGHGGGARFLRAAGVAVTTGVLAARAEHHNRVFFTWARGRPFVVLKAAMTLDGKIATAAGESRWITGPQARALAHRWRAELDAIAVGRRTVVADDPRLTVRLPDQPRATDPLRVVLDSAARTPLTARVLAGPGALIACRRDAPARRIAALRQRGADIVQVAADAGGKVAVRPLLRALAARGVASLLVEGGAEVHAAFLAARAVDELRLFVAPTVFGGGAHGGPSWVGGPPLERLAQATKLTLVEPPRQIGSDTLLVLRPTKAPW